MIQASASAEPSETSQPNDAVAKAKTPVYDTYDPEKSLANRPVPGPKHEEAEPPGLLLYLLAGCAFVGTVLGFRRLFVRLTGTDPWLKVQELLPGLIEHTPVFRDFLETLNSGAPVPIEPTRQTVAPATEEGTSGQAEFFHLAPKVIPGLRSKLAEVSRSADDAVRLRLLHQIRTDLTTCNVDSDAPVMLPAWQLVSALDGLLVQTLKRASNITHCVIRTIAGALDVLDALSAPATSERLSAARPARLLAVEDDPVSREAISIALKKTLPAADLAENGEAALALAAKNRYDVVFLDVELPGMNGFEVCTKLREIPLNRITPVVFVTQHADFDSRAKSFLSGGQDLISKPYLSFEIAVKAITLVIRARLAAGKQSAPVAASKTDGVSPNAPAAPNPPASAASSEPAVPDATGAAEVEAAVAAALSPFQDEFAAAFFAATQAHLPTLRSQLKELAAAREDSARHDVLSNLYLGIRALTADAEQAELRSLVRYCSILQTFFRKLLEDTEAFAPHLVDMADAAFDVLESLSRARLNPNLYAPPLNILVVDDDATCRRACSGALQLAFQQPHVADSGDAAVELARQFAFDAVFMDVQMPGMDGFAACAKIHELPLNTHAPVVFVTGQTDLKSRHEAAASGGCGFIPKPAMAVEITLTALTLALQRRIAMCQATSGESAGQMTAA